MWTRIALATLALILLMEGTVAGTPKRLELGFPQLSERVQVVLPENYSPDRKWPAVFYYHGKGGKPTTGLMQAHTRNKDWIVVGMTYTQKGNLPANPQYVEKEFVILASTRRHLALSELHGGTRQAEIALADHERIKKLMLHLRAQRKIEAEQEAKKEEGQKELPRGPGIDPFNGGGEERRRIPNNPLLRK